MHTEQTILPIISRVKMIFSKDIRDFALLNDEGYRYTHTNVIIAHSTLIIKELEELKNTQNTYRKATIDGCETWLFYNLSNAYFVIMLNEPLDQDTSIDEIYHRLLEVSFFDDHLNVYLKHALKEDYALVVTTTEGDVLVMNNYAEHLFGKSVNNIEALNHLFVDKKPLMTLYENVKHEGVQKMEEVTLKRGPKFLANAFLEAKNLITFIFTLEAQSSFYLNILRGFDYLRMGVAHFEIAENPDEPLDAKILFMNARYTEMMGIKLRERLGKTVYEIYPNYDRVRFKRYRDVALGAPPLMLEEYVSEIDKYVQIYCYSPRKGEFVNIYYDTSHFYQAKASEKAQLMKMQTMSRFAEMGYFEIDMVDKTFSYDPLILNILEQDSLDFFKYQEVFKQIIHPSDKRHIYKRNAELLSGQIDHGRDIFKVIINGKEKYLEYYMKPLKRDSDSYKPISILGLIRDVTEQEKNKAQIEYYANHDALTKVYNRHHLKNHLKSKETSYPLTLALLDLDGLKTVNDVLGHYSGDEVITYFASLLKKIYKDSYIARLGGDEFIVLLERHIDEFKEREKALKDELKHYLKFQLPLSVSIGYHTLNHPNDYKTALIHAEHEMYRDKLLARSTRKKDTLKIIHKYLLKEEPLLSKRIEFMLALGDKFLKAMCIKRKEEYKILRQLIEYHAIGRVKRYVHFNELEDAKDKYHALVIETGFKILSTLFSNDKLSQAFLYQCEYVDGSGKPHGFKGQKIPLLSRMFAILYDYTTLIIQENPCSKELALSELEKNKARYDLELLEAFMDLHKK